MRLNETQLRNKIRKVIKETLLVEHEMSLVLQDDAIYLVDDEGNEKYFADVEEAEDYGLRQVGDSVPYEGGSRGGYYGSYSSGRRSSGYGRRRYY